jgi:predicted nicotinamide N-methyase
VLIGDPGRSYLPKDRLQPIAEYSVPNTRELEDAQTKRSMVWRLLDL